MSGAHPKDDSQPPQAAASSLAAVYALCDFSSTHEIRGFGSSTLRWIWMLYTQRLTQAGRWLMWPTVGFLAYTSTSLSYQSYHALAYLFAFWLLTVLTALLWRPNAQLQFRHSDRITAGEILPVSVEVELQRSWINPQLYLLPHQLPPDIKALDEEGACLTQSKGKLVVGLQCLKRGTHALKAFRLETDFPFGLMRAYRSFTHTRTLLVYPRFTALTRLEIPASRRYQPGGVALASIVGDSAEFVGNREFRDGDNVRDIDWQTTARLNRPIVREYREEYFMRVAVILDTHVPKGAGAQRLESFERAVSLSAAVGEFLARREYIIDIFAAGPNLYHLIAGRSLAYLDQILDILACVERSPVEPFEIITPELMENMSRLSAIVCVFLDWDDARRKFVRQLQEHGVGIKVIVVGEGEGDSQRSDELCRFVSPRDVEAGIEEL